MSENNYLTAPLSKGSNNNMPSIVDCVSTLCLDVEDTGNHVAPGWE